VPVIVPHLLVFLSSILTRFSRSPYDPLLFHYWHCTSDLTARLNDIMRRLIERPAADLVIEGFPGVLEKLPPAAACVAKPPLVSWAAAGGSFSPTPGIFDHQVRAELSNQPHSMMSFQSSM